MYMRILYYDNKCQVELVRKNKLKLPVSSPDINSMTTLYGLIVDRLLPLYDESVMDIIAARLLLVLSQPSEEDEEPTDDGDRWDGLS